MQALDATSRPGGDALFVPGNPAKSSLPWLARLLLTSGAAHALYQRVRRQRTGLPFFRAVLSELAVTYTSDAPTLRQIPAQGPLVVVANHPFGILEGAVLADMVSQVRSDVRVLTNHLLCQLPELRDFCIPINTFGGAVARQDNQRGLSDALAWLQGGGALIVFPAGEVSHAHLRAGCITDPRWHTTAARLIQKTQAQALPVHIQGNNSALFHAVGLLHPRLRTLRLPRELLNKQGRHVNLRLGQARIATSDTAQTDPGALTAYLRARTYALASPRPAIAPPSAPAPRSPIAEPAPAERVAAELAALTPNQLLHEDSDFMVYGTRATHIPYTMRELGRAREATFRAVGEGTGRGLDLDGFDAYYEHFILWHKADQRLAGAYRLADVQSIRKRHATAALYTQTLFDYTPEFFAALGPALELGRSFVVAQYQKQYGALLALWKAVAGYVARRPQTPVLMGAVSISRDYTSVSRDLMVRYLMRYATRADLAAQARPRVPFVGPKAAGWDPNALSAGLRDADALSHAISDIEPDGKGLPVLLRKYLKLGGRVVGFNIDRQFCGVLDALIVVDLRDTERRMLSRFMGPRDLAQFLQYHAA